MGGSYETLKYARRLLRDQKGQWETIVMMGIGLFLGASKEKKARKQAKELQRQMEEAKHQADLKSIDDMKELNEAKTKLLVMQKEAYTAAQFQTGTGPRRYFQ